MALGLGLLLSRPAILGWGGPKHCTVMQRLVVAELLSLTQSLLITFARRIGPETKQSREISEIERPR
jgi:hypothetical protein